METLLKRLDSRVRTQGQQMERMGNSVINVQNSVTEGKEQQAYQHMLVTLQSNKLTSSVNLSASKVELQCDKCSELLGGLDNRFDEDIMLATALKNAPMEELFYEIDKRQLTMGVNPTVKKRLEKARAKKFTQEQHEIRIATLKM